MDKHAIPPLPLSSPITLAAVALVCALAAPASAWAQTTYKSTMPDGKVVYGEKPAPGAVKSEPLQINTKPLSGSSGGTGGSRTEESSSSQNQQQRQQILQEGLSREQKRQAADAEAQQWQQNLAAAQQAARNGVEPIEGERIGTAGGASRLTDAYHERQRKLQAEVVRAQGNLDNALKQLNNVR